MKHLILLGGLIAVSALAQPPAEPSSETLDLCVTPILLSQDKRHAHQVLNNECAIQKSSWMVACTSIWAAKGFTAETVCASQLGQIGAKLDLEAEKTRPMKSLKRTALDRANEDLSKNRPLPGLPNLQAPIFVREAALICESLGALQNPNTAALLSTKACVRNTQRIRVKVILPTAPDSYLHSHVFRSVRVTWQANPPSSVGNAYLGWVSISSLQN